MVKTEKIAVKAKQPGSKNKQKTLTNRKLPSNRIAHTTGITRQYKIKNMLLKPQTRKRNSKTARKQSIENS